MKSSWLTFYGVISVLTMASKAFAGGAPIAAGFYDNAAPGGAPILTLIRSAKKTLDMEVYEMDDPGVISAIRNALKRGVVVHIVKEAKPVGAACKVFDGEAAEQSGAASCADQQKLVDDVNSGGGEYIAFATPALCGDNGAKSCLEHGKIAIADSRMALVTTGNFNVTNLCDLQYSPKTCNRDYSYLTADKDVVQTLQKVVERDRAGDSYDPDSEMVGDASTKLTIGPDSLSPIVDFIKSAKQSIVVENQYLKDSTMNKALMDAARAGIDVRVIVASACSFGKPKASEVKKLTAIFRGFDAAGIQSKMFNKNVTINGEAGYMHAKGIVVDGTRAWLGSVNGSTQALTLNREFGIFFDDDSSISALSSLMGSDFSDQNEESWQDSLQCAENRKP